MSANVTFSRLHLRDPAWVGDSRPDAPLFVYPLSLDARDWLNHDLLPAFFPSPPPIIGSLFPNSGLRGHYRLENDDGQWVVHVKPAEFYDLTAICTAAQIANHVAEAGVLVADFRQALNGSFHAIVDGMLATVTRFRNGRHCKFDPADCARLGDMLGRVHTALGCFPNPDEVGNRSAALHMQRRSQFEILQRHLDRVPAPWRDLLTDPTVIAPSGSGPAQVLHGDITPGNIIWLPDGQLCLLDFEDAPFNFGSPVVDLASALLRFALDLPEHASCDQARANRDALLAAYFLHRPDIHNCDIDVTIRCLARHYLFVLSTALIEGGHADIALWTKFSRLIDIADRI